MPNENSNYDKDKADEWARNVQISSGQNWEEFYQQEKLIWFSMDEKTDKDTQDA